jgi:hypothetical protein
MNRWTEPTRRMQVTGASYQTVAPYWWIPAATDQR